MSSRRAKPGRSKKGKEQAAPAPQDGELLALALEGLNDRERLFVVEYARSGNAAASYRVAYPNCSPERSRVGGAHMKARPHVAQAIERTVSSLVASRAEVLVRLGEMLADGTIAPAARIQAAALILKAQGGFAPERVQVEHSGDVAQVDPSRLSLSTLRELLAARANGDLPDGD